MGEESSMNMNENVASALCYVLTWLTGIIFYFLEKKNKTIRFHTLQSILAFLPLTILGWRFTGPLGISYPTGLSIFYYIGILIYVVTFVLWLILIIKAYQGEKLKLPVIGDIAEKHS